MLFSQIKLGIPSIWLKSSDVYRSIETICNFDNRDYFTIDLNKGFSKFVDGQWKSVLVEIPNRDNPDETIETVTHDFTVAYQFMNADKTGFVSKKSTFLYPVFTKPDELLMMYGGLISSLQYSYRQSFWADDNDLMPIQFIFISPFACPEDYLHLFTNIEFELPNLDELSTVLAHIETSTNSLVFDSSKKQQIVKAGLGLTESSFVNLCLTSVVETGTIDPEVIYNMKMADIKRNGILEIKKPTITFDQIGGLDNIKQIINRNAALWHNPDKAKEFGVSPIARMLMVGIPGTGKSAICEATANALGLDLARTGVSQVMNSFVGQSEQNMRNVFKQISVMAPLCVWIDEFGRDLSGGASSSHVDGGTTDRVHGEFLTGLQELPKNVFLMCAANQLENLRPEMLRADRFDKIMFVGLPSFMERIDIIKIYLDDINTDHVFDYEQLSQATQYFTGAEIKSLIKETKFNIALGEMRTITTQDIVNTAPTIRNILWNKNRQMIQDLYATAIEQWDWASTDQFNDAKLVVSGSPITTSKPANKSLQWTTK
jgi:ATP-dependent 26S proteasome regulatory subunit